MFTMMNTERVSVGIQGWAWARPLIRRRHGMRKTDQGRALSGPKYPDQAADPIIVHPDVRRMLMTMRAYNEGLSCTVGLCRALDAEKHSPEPEVRQRASDFIALMTPVVKAMFTDMSFESANLAVQCYGGHGYIRESGVEQYARDARITMIYEGTNGVQALDLVGRKRRSYGALSGSFFHPVSAFIEENNVDGPMKPMVEALAKAFGALQLSTATVAQRAMKDPEEAGAASTDYLRLLGLVAMGYCFQSHKIAGISAVLRNGGQALDAKIKTAIFFFERILPQATAHFLSIKAGKKSLMALEDEVFDAPRISWRPPCDPGHRRADVSGLWSGPGVECCKAGLLGTFPALNQRSSRRLWRVARRDRGTACGGRGGGTVRCQSHRSQKQSKARG
jgi:hypothetical protein